ncbi:unnamed protein product [Acanthocheilonema viteae]|uniref:Uncharacterized protein n=1 Tax=Acanthocheilonema viteae TaxID=6277 RepID=A0A498SDT2_ACAVI|nr:unnamed protein product [Acanthocheilonema viteae]
MLRKEKEREGSGTERRVSLRIYDPSRETPEVGQKYLKVLFDVSCLSAERFLLKLVPNLKLCDTNIRDPEISQGLIDHRGHKREKIHQQYQMTATGQLPMDLVGTSIVTGGKVGQQKTLSGPFPLKGAKKLKSSG